jgi:hypothetical protein
VVLWVYSQRVSTDAAPSRAQGNTLAGFFTAFVGGCVGFAAVWIFATGLRTKKGAVLGLIAWTAAVGVIWLTRFMLASASG